MGWTDRLWNRLRRRALEADIDDEIRFHVASRIADNLAAGMSAEEARRDALRRFGSPAAATDATRDADFGATIDTVRQDVRFALRGLGRRPGFTAIALLTLALGAGANVGIFTIVRSVVLRPLPFPQADRLVALSYAPPDAGSWLGRGLDDRDYVAFREQARGFEALASFSLVPLTMTGAGDAVRVTAFAVTPDFLRVLAVAPAAGRGFEPADAAGGPPVCVLSDRLWRSRFGADPATLGRVVVLDGVPHVVVGIMPSGFAYPGDAELWTPLAMAVSPNLTFARPVIGRLAPGTTRAQAQAELATFLRTANGEAAAQDGRVAAVQPLQDAVVGDASRPLLIFSGAVAFVLLIAVSNVANLLLMRAASRRHEIVTRLALGASRGRLFRLLLTEGAILSAGGAGLGLALAALGTPALLARLPAGRLPRIGEVRADGAVLLFVLGLTVLTTLLVSILPILQSAREDLAAVSKDTSAGTTSRRHRARHVLVVAELALALVLLVGAGLLARSFLQLRAVDPGFDASGVLTMTLDLPETTYGTAAALQQLHGRLREALTALPEVESAGAVNWLPLGQALLRGDIHADGGAPLPEDYTVTKAAVSPGYFGTMRLPLRGRDFSDADTADAGGVVIVSDAVARRVWPGESAIGKRLSVEGQPSPGDWLTVIGVAGDVRQNGPAEAVIPAIYRPLRQVAFVVFLNHMTFVMRTGGDPVAVAPAVRTTLARVDPNLAPQTLTSMDARLAGAVAEPRFQTQLLGGFAALALLLAAIGVYGVLTASVVERRREIGIRMALGADRAAVMRLVLRRTLWLTGIGLAAGLAGAVALTRLLGALLFDVDPMDGAAFAGAALVLLAVSLIAGVLPARRASTLDPVVALRGH